MHLVCRLREIRGKRPLRDVAEQAGINRATLSMIENGRLLPKQEHIPAMEAAYNAPLHEWYPPQVLAVINRDFDEEQAA